MEPVSWNLAQMIGGRPMSATVVQMTWGPRTSATVAQMAQMVRGRPTSATVAQMEGGAHERQCKVKENYADIMVTRWNLRVRALATHASWSIECMMRHEVWSA